MPNIKHPIGRTVCLPAVDLMDWLGRLAPAYVQVDDGGSSLIAYDADGHVLGAIVIGSAE
jgi:hypothetical protein